MHPGEIPGTHFQGLSRPQFRRREPRKKSPGTPPGIDPGTVRLVTQCLNHYATQAPFRRLTCTKHQEESTSEKHVQPTKRVISVAIYLNGGN